MTEPEYFTIKDATGNTKCSLKEIEPWAWRGKRFYETNTDNEYPIYLTSPKEDLSGEFRIPNENTGDETDTINILNVYYDNQWIRPLGITEQPTFNITENMDKTNNKQYDVEPNTNSGQESTITGNKGLFLKLYTDFDGSDRAANKQYISIITGESKFGFQRDDDVNDEGTIIWRWKTTAHPDLSDGSGGSNSALNSGKVLIFD